MIIFGSTIEAADHFRTGDSLLEKSLLERLLELHDLHIVFISDSSNLLKMGILEDRMRFTKEIVDHKDALLATVRELKNFGSVLLDQRENLSWDSLITYVDLIFSLSIVHDCWTCESLSLHERAFRLRN